MRCWLDHEILRMIRFTLNSVASPPAVLAALRTHAGEWRQSQIPDALRRAGIFSVECRLRDAICILQYARSGGTTLATAFDPLARAHLQLRATVVPGPAGGTAVMVDVSYRGHWYAAVAAACFVGAVAVLLRPAVSVVVVPFAGGVVGLNYLFLREANHALTRDDLEPAYLIARLEQAVAAAGSVGSSAPAS